MLTLCIVQIHTWLCRLLSIPDTRLDSSHAFLTSNGYISTESGNAKIEARTYKEGDIIEAGLLISASLEIGSHSPGGQ